MVDQGKCLIRVTPQTWGPVATGGFPPSRLTSGRASATASAAAPASRCWPARYSTPTTARRCDPSRSQQWFDSEQVRVHRAVNGYGPSALGTTPAGMARALTKHSASPRCALPVAARPPRRPLADVLDAVAAGWPVAMLIGAVLPRHWVLLTEIDGARCAATSRPPVGWWMCRSTTFGWPVVAAGLSAAVRVRRDPDALTISESLFSHRRFRPEERRDTATAGSMMSVTGSPSSMVCAVSSRSPPTRITAAAREIGGMPACGSSRCR